MPLLFNEDERRKILNGQLTGFLRDWVCALPKFLPESLQTCHIAPNTAPFAVIQIGIPKKIILGDMSDEQAHKLGFNSRADAVQDWIKNSKVSGRPSGSGRVIWFIDFKVIVKP